MFQAENTEVLGISGNAPFSQKAFADFAKITYPLLSDRDGKVMQAFGVYDEPTEGEPNGLISSSIRMESFVILTSVLAIARRIFSRPKNCLPKSRR